MQSVIIALAKQQIETLTKQIDELAEKIEALTIILETYNQQLKELVKKNDEHKKKKKKIPENK